MFVECLGSFLSDMVDVLPTLDVVVSKATIRIVTFSPTSLYKLPHSHNNLHIPTISIRWCKWPLHGLNRLPTPQTRRTRRAVIVLYIRRSKRTMRHLVQHQPLPSVVVEGFAQLFE